MQIKMSKTKGKFCQDKFLKCEHLDWLMANNKTNFAISQSKCSIWEIGFYKIDLEMILTHKKSKLSYHKQDIFECTELPKGCHACRLILFNRNSSFKQSLFHLFSHSKQGELQKPRKLYEMTRSVLTQSKKYATSTYYYYNVRMKLMCQFYHHLLLLSAWKRPNKQPDPLLQTK